MGCASSRELDLRLGNEYYEDFIHQLHKQNKIEDFNIVKMRNFMIIMTNFQLRQRLNRLRKPFPNHIDIWEAKQLETQLQNRTRIVHFKRHQNV